MGREPRFDLPDSFHHVFSRGDAKKPIFLDDEDRSFFLRRLRTLVGELRFGVYAYCLMGNHFHFVVERRDQPLHALMHRLLTAYARVFNDRWDTVGHTFQGRYGSRRIANDADLAGVIRYVHANPVSAGLVKEAADWKWSGHRELVTGTGGLVDVAFVVSLFGGREGYEAFVRQPLPCEDRVSLDELAGVDMDRLRGPAIDRAASAARRHFIEEALATGYKRAEVARYLNRSGAAITRLLARNVKA